jgi:small subunit ribosomal protein S1
VVSVTGEGAFVDIAGKSQGWLPADELVEDDKELAVGDIVEVAAVDYDRRDGLIILSRKSADQQLLIRNLEPGVLVEARVTGSNTGGLELDVKGLRAFMPASQIDIGRVEDFDKLINERFICEVVDVERGDENIVLSRRNVLERERLEQAGKLWEELEPGQLRHGIVRRLMEFGAFVDLGGIDGLLHVREMSWARVKDPSDIVKEGQGIDVVVIGVDREKDRISLSLRQAGGDPWTTVEHKYQVGTRLQGQISSLQDFGAFTELEPGIEGLIPISQMTWAGRIRHPSDVVQVGMIVDVEVINLDIEKRRIGLSMKSLAENPWDGAEQKYQVDQIVTGTVARVTDFGAFVTLEAGIDGLVHISELADRRIERASSVVKEGQQLQVKILSIDAGERRISLTAKNLGASPETEVAEVAEPEAPRKPKDRPLRGGLSF